MYSSFSSGLPAEKNTENTQLHKVILAHVQCCNLCNYSTVSHVMISYHFPTKDCFVLFTFPYCKKEKGNIMLSAHECPFLASITGKKNCECCLSVKKITSQQRLISNSSRNRSADKLKWLPIGATCPILSSRYSFLAYSKIEIG